MSQVNPPGLNRRDFLKVVGVGTAATAAACDPQVPFEHVLPYVSTPDQIVPGVATWFSTRCEECPAGCGVIARNREGRVVKLEGNPDHPTNRGNLCARGQAGIQATYNPDRLAGPHKGGVPTDWDTALETIAEGIASARSTGKQVAWLGRSRTGSVALLVGQFMGAAGGRALHWEPLGQESLRAAVKAAFGVDSIPSYRLDEARTIVSFGADFLGTWLDPVGHAIAYADSRDPSKGGFVSRLVCVEPRVGTSSAMADLHLAAVPGTEAGVAMALAKLLAGRNGYAGPAAGLLEGVDSKALAEAAGLSFERLEEVAGWLAEGPSVVLPGGTATSAAATDLAVATLVLNEVAGNVGRSVQFGPEHNVAGQATWRDVAALVADCAQGKVGVLFLDGSNPVYALPADAAAREALAKVDLVVAFANEPDDTTSALAGNALVLPTGTTLESWGDGEEVLGRYTLQQPAMRPLEDSRQVGDVLLGVAKAAGLQTPAPPPAIQVEAGEGESAAAPTEGAALAVSPQEATAAGESAAAEEAAQAPTPTALPGLDSASYREYLQKYWEAAVFPQFAPRFQGGFAEFWTASLAQGGQFFDIQPFALPFVLGAAPATAAATPQGEGSVLALVPHPFLYDGRHANKPWAQEVPEPLSTFAWGTWAEIHPEVAHELGLAPTDAVTVKTDAGSVTVGWFGNPGIRKDTVAVVMGNGHEGAGRYAKFGANPMKLVTGKVDPASGGLSYVSTRAAVSRASDGTNLHAAAGSLTLEDRPTINYTVAADTLAHADGPGSLVHAHAVPFDERLEELGVRDMYPEPEHPTYRFAMAVDLNRCTGCGACETACYSENNLPVVGPETFRKARTMNWIRLSRYWQSAADGHEGEGPAEQPDVRFQPVMCQQCSHAPCESVCPVLATYHNLDGLNAMVYNRCVGTRYCANNCPYTARRFNYHTFGWPEPFQLMLNPDVNTREMGVMEKCTFCVQRIRATKDTWRDRGETVPDTALVDLPACVAACPADAMTFGNAKDPESTVSKKFADPRAYAMLDELNTKPAVRYLARIVHSSSGHADSGSGHGGGH